jgi:twitching motility protein PilT
MNKIDALFDEMMAKKGSDLHLQEGHPPRIRLHGHIHPLDQPDLTAASLKDMLREICSEQQWEQYWSTGDLDFAYQMGEKARFRANFFRYVDGFGAIFRIIPSKVLTLDDLEAPDVFKTFANLRSGLVLVTGPTGSGKSTTLAAIIDFINSTRVKKIITIEEPVEFVHPIKKSLIVHREVGEDTVSFASGLRGAIRSDANVILVGEMRDRETIELALTATEMGVLVFGTLHTNSAPKTVDRIIDVFPAKQKPAIRSILSNSLRGIVAQQLLRSADGKRRWAAHEILMYTPPLQGIIRHGDSNKVTSYIQTGRKMGMITLDDRLLELVQEGKVTKEEAYKKAQEKSRFQ